MSRIENASDQVLGYAQEAYDAIHQLMKQHSCSFEEAAKATEIGVTAMQADAIHHLADDRVLEALAGIDITSELSDVVSAINDAEAVLMRIANNG